MAWSRFEPGFTRHPKRLKCGPISSWLWVCSVDHCTVYRTDGFLEAASVPALVPGLSAGTRKKAVIALLGVGSWEETAGGYRVHGYLEHNLSKAQAEEAAEAGRRRYHRWKDGRNAVSNDSPNGATNAYANALVTPPLLGHQSVSQSVKESKKSKALSGSTPDPAVLEVLEFLNRKAGRHYRPGIVNRRFIAGRLKDGATVAQCKAIISRRAAKWKGDPKMDEYLRPKTLFGRENFEQYLGELAPTPEVDNGEA
jgi:uncharacterized phage protein (TIGR02220 family)